MDQVKSNFFENQILEAIETVTNSIVSKLKFDQTILCTITDDSNKQNGIYEVTDKTSTFTATSSDTSYSKDMVVYVLIPQGKYENQKTIIGKYVDDTATAINHVASTENIIEIKKFSSLDVSCEGWERDSTKWSLLANKKNASNDIITKSELFNISWDENTNIYTCVGLKAKFKTRLYDYLIKKGSYGLVLALQGYKTDEEGKLKLFQDEYVFNNSEMYGDPYNYNDYVEHDIVFDLTENFKDIKITGIKLDFYEKNDFLDINNELIPYSYLVNGEESLYPDNLFVKDIDLIFGYTQDDILEEGIQIYTPNDFKYATREDSKNILLKWFVQNEIGSSQTAYGIIDELEEVPKKDGEAIDNFSIYWYRYKIGNQEPDPILGKGYWEIIPGAVYRDKKFVHQMRDKKVWDVKLKKEVPVYKKDEYGNDTTEIEQEEAPELVYTLIKDNNGRYYTTANNKLAIATEDILEDSSIQKYRVEMNLETVYNFSEADDLDEPFKYLFGPNELLSEEKIKAVLKCREYEEVLTPDEKDETIQYVTFKESYDLYESNELLFENKNPAVKKLSEINLIREMRLSCDDGSNGVYMIYNDITNEIGDSTKTNNRLSVYFDNYSTIDIPKDQEDCKITWKIPANNSMIKPVDFRMENGFKDIRKTNSETGDISGFDKDLVSKDTVAYIPSSSGASTVAEEEKDPHLIEWSKEPIDGYYQCSYYWTSDEDETTDSIFENQSLYMHYGLNPAYVSSAKNNTIICEIEKYGRVYKAEMSMVFGSAGANGTKYTLYINLEKEYGTDSIPTDKKTGLLDNKKPTSNEDVSFLEWKGVGNNPWIKVVAKLYDEHFTDITAGKKFSWNWHTGKVYGLEMYSDGEVNNSNECYIRLTYNADKNNDKTLDDFTLVDYYGILKVSTGADWLGDNTSLDNYLPIPIRRADSGITEYIGAKKLIYDAQGKAPKDDSFQALHKLEVNGIEVKDLTWELKLIKEDSVLLKSYAPTFDYDRTYEWKDITDASTGEVIDRELISIEGENSNRLIPTDLYFSELNKIPMSIIAYDVDREAIFVQPLLYMQNQYGISMLNNWDGAQIVDAVGNKILTALVGAGIKNSNNTFSGVFMGEVEAVGSEKKTGLLGFNQGIHTFGFHTDGTAFIGPSGGGRITFDGNEGIIESAEKNTIFNLKEGSIYLSNSATKKSDGANLNPSVEIILDSNGRDSGPFFQIKDSSTSNNLIKISGTEYYLQSVAGHTKFDLMKGSIHLSNENYSDPEGKVPAGKIVIDSDGSPAYFQISHYQPPVYEEDGETIKEAARESKLIHIGPRGYYLQSFNYVDGSYANETMSDGSTLSVYTPGTGMKIDLKSGFIQGYDFKLVAGQKTDSNDYRLIITSDQNKKPLTIGSNFYVDWDGSLHANNGKFMGEIEANTGTIGGWNIDTNVLYTGASSLSTSWTAGDGKAIIHTGNGISVSGLSFKTKTVWQPGTEGKGEYPTSSAISTLDNIILNIGKNFAVNKEGKLYIQDAQIGGYATETDLTNASSSLKDVITSVDTTLTTNIGKVNLRAQGSITKLGNLNGQAVFLSTAYSNSNPTLIEGYLVNGNFYPKVAKYSDLIDITKDEYYVDLNTDTYYIAEGDNSNLQLIELTELPITVKETDINKVYISEEDNVVYRTKDYKQGESVISPNTSAYYFDLNGTGLYQYKTSHGYILTDPDEVMIFTVSTEGLMTASNAVISGTIFAKAGNIGGWDIRRIAVDGTLSGSLNYGNNHSTNNGGSQNTPWTIDNNHANLTPVGLYISNGDLFGQTDGVDNIKQCILNIGKKFAVDKNGTLYANGGSFSGNIQASTGKIGNWEITVDGNLIGYAYSDTTDKTLLSTTTLHAISGSEEDLNFSDIEVTDELQYSTTINATSSVSCYVINEGSYKDEETSEIRYKYSIYSAPQTYQICQASFSNSYQSFQISGIKNTSSLKIVGFENIDISDLSHDFWLSENYYYRKLDGVFTSSTNKNSYSYITFSQDYSYTRNASMKISKTSSKDSVYMFLTGKSDVDTSDNFYTTCSVRIALLKVFDTERILEPLYGSAFSITGTELSNFSINSVNYSDINLSGNFSILRNGNIRIYPGAINVLNGENEKGIIYINYDKLATTQIKNYLTDTYSLPPLLSVLTPSETIWSVMTTESSDRSLFGILSHSEGESNYAGLVIDSTGNVYASGVNPILGHQEYPWNNIYLNRFDTPTFKNTIAVGSSNSFTLTRGGFHLNSTTPSNEFWPDALYTYNTVKINTSNFKHYVGFIRAAGETSAKMSNVFVGCKYIVGEMNTDFPTSSEWSSSSTYNFYIRFDGKIYTKSTIQADGDIFSQGYMYAKQGLQVDGRVLLKSYNLSPSTTSGSIQIVGSAATLAMDSNTILVENNTGTGGPWKPLYLGVSGILPGFPPSKEEDGTTTYYPVPGAKLGSSNYPWATMNGDTLNVETASNVSDARLKDIQYSVTKNQLLSIYNNLNPVAYKYKNLSQNENHSRTHYGFLAQEVEKIIENVGLTSEDFAAVQIENLDEPIPGCEDGKKYYLNYNEFHGLHVLKNQEQDSRIQELENKVQELEQQILELRGKGV